ncbi:unnamed protein product [Closterium sp. NIES-53]
MHLLPEVDCGPKAWTVLKELHAPTSVVATLMLERELSALRLSEGEPVQPVLDKMRNLYAKLATAGITYPEQTKCLKMLSLLPELWLQFTSGLSLPQNQSLWTLEWVRTKILEEDFRRRQLRGGDDGNFTSSLELNQRHHVMHLLPEVDCGPKAWTVLKELHAPTSVVATLMLERELSALRLSEGEPVQPVLDKMRDLYAKLATAGITYPEQTKCLKMLSLLPESWLQFTSGLSLPQNQSLWTLEWVRTKILEEDFRRRQLRGRDDGSSGYGMQGSRRGRGRGFGGAGRGAKKDDDSN